MNASGTVDQDAVIRARTMLLGSRRASSSQLIWAYRVLAEVSPLTYRPKLAAALTMEGYHAERRSPAKLALHAEAVENARLIDAGEPKRTEILVRALSALESALYALGRREEGFAICQEMAEARRRGFERGQGTTPGYGHRRLSVVLAEDGQHEEAAEICGQEAQVERSQGATSTSWSAMEWAAELDAAGRHDAALEAFAQVVNTSRDALDAKGYPLASLVWKLVHHARMSDNAGRCEEARAIREEALTLLVELDRTGERASWSNITASWTHLFALSGRDAEPAASAHAPAPAFGAAHHTWSWDIRDAYFAALPALEAAVTALTDACRTDSRQYLPELVVAHRRAAIRSALHSVHCGDRRRMLKQLRPIFDQGVALTSRLHALTRTEHALRTWSNALIDRSMFLLAAKQYGEAYEDFREALAKAG